MYGPVVLELSSDVSNKPTEFVFQLS